MLSIQVARDVRSFLKIVLITALSYLCWISSILVNASESTVNEDNVEALRMHLLVWMLSIQVARDVRSFLKIVLITALSYLCWISSILVNASESTVNEDNVEALRKERNAAKPWFARPIAVGDFDLPVSPATVVLGLLALLYLVNVWNTSQSYAEAAHILLMDQSDKARTTLEQWKTKIGTDGQLFAKYAKEHSACPSKAGGGNLGRFRKGDMAPPFDRAVFDPQAPLQTTIGPIRTNFGYHLIYIYNRQLANDYREKKKKN